METTQMSENIDLGLVYRSSRGRPIDVDHVEELKESIIRVGQLLNPICVRKATRYRGPNPFEAYEIVAGNHRYEAAKLLGWGSIACTVVDIDGLRVELAEIDENLIRSDFSPAQEARAISRRKEIYEELFPETKAEAFKGNQHTGRVASEKSAFTTATAESTGKSRRSVEIAAARGKALGEDLKDVEGTSLDKGVELDALAALPASDRKEVIARAKAGEKVSARSAEALAVAAPAVAEPPAGPKSILQRIQETEAEDAEPVAAAPEATVVEEEDSEPHAKSIALLRAALRAFADEIAAGGDDPDFDDDDDGARFREAASSPHIDSYTFQILAREIERVIKIKQDIAKRDARDQEARAREARREARLAPPADHRGEWRESPAT